MHAAQGGGHATPVTLLSSYFLPASFPPPSFLAPLPPRSLTFLLHYFQVATPEFKAYAKQIRANAQVPYNPRRPTARLPTPPPPYDPRPSPRHPPTHPVLTPHHTPPVPHPNPNPYPTPTQALAKFLIGKGYKLTTEGTENHLMLWDLRPLGLTGSKVNPDP